MRVSRGAAKPSKVERPGGGHPVRVVGGSWGWKTWGSSVVPRNQIASNALIQLISSRSQAIDAGSLEQVGELLAGIEHPCLHRALGNPDDRAGLFHRLLVVVYEVDYFAMRRRQLCHAGAQNLAGIAAVQRGFRRIGLVGDFEHVPLAGVLRPALTDSVQPA